MNYHERVPRHGGEELVEQVSGTQPVDDPIVTVAVDNGLVEVENHNNAGHFSRTIEAKRPSSMYDPARDKCK